MIKKIVGFLIGLFILSLGIAFSVKADFGISAVTSLPMTISAIIDGLSAGEAVIAFSLFYTLMQVIMLRRNFPKNQFLQIPLAFAFGYFTDLSLYLLRNFSTEFFLVQVLYFVVGLFLIAFAVIFIIEINLCYTHAEGIMQVISQKFMLPFARVKLLFDISLVILSLILSLLFLGEFGYIKLGTVVAALAVGPIIKLLHKHVKKLVGLVWKI